MHAYDPGPAVSARIVLPPSFCSTTPTPVYSLTPVRTSALNPPQLSVPWFIIIGRLGPTPQMRDPSQVKPKVRTEGARTTGCRTSRHTAQLAG